MTPTIEQLLKEAQQAIEAEEAGKAGFKQGFVDAQSVAMGTDPAMGGQMDPAMAAQDPAMMGGQMDPAMMGAAPPADPAMGGAAPPPPPGPMGDPAAASSAMTPQPPKIKIDTNAEMLITKRMLAKAIDMLTRIGMHFQIPNFSPMSLEEMTALPEELASLRQQEPSGGGGAGGQGAEPQSAIAPIEPMQPAIPKQGAQQVLPADLANQQSKADALLMLLEYANN